MTGHADEPRQSLRSRFDRRLQGPARSHGLIPVVRVAQGVQLDQVDMVDAEPLERPVDVLARLVRGALAGLGREEEVPPVASHPRPDAKLGVAVPRRGVDVVDAVAEQELQRAIRLRLAGAGQGGRPEQRHRALMARPSERSSLDHRYLHGHPGRSSSETRHPEQIGSARTA